MSVWGPGPFDNDDAADWFADFRDESHLRTIKEALQEISAPEHIGYLDVTDCAEAIAAAEVLAELLGSRGDAPVFNEEDEEHEEVLEVLADEIKHEDQRDLRKLVEQATDALGIILNDEENSELRQLWEEDPEGLKAWTAAMTALQQRLRKVAIP